MKAIICRKYNLHQTTGTLVLFNDGEVLLTCKTLELKNMGNIKKLSCIPEGIYKVSKIIRPSGKDGLWVQNVPNRSAILIHTGNHAAGEKLDIEGCILVGSKYKDINNDGHLDVIESTITFDNLFSLANNEFELEIFS